MQSQSNQKHLGNLKYVCVEKMDPKFILWRTDKQSAKASHAIFSKLVKHHISSLIRLQSPEFNKDFVEDIPRELQYPGKGLRKAKTGTEKAVRTNENALVVEAIKIVGNTPVEKKRKTRFAGDYKKEKVIEAKVLKEPLKRKRIRKESNTSIVSSSSNVSSQVSNSGGLKMKINLKRQKPKVDRRALLDSSSSDESECEQVANVSNEQLIQLYKRNLESSITTPTVIDLNEIDNNEMAEINELAKTDHIPLDKTDHIETHPLVQAKVAPLSPQCFIEPEISTVKTAKPLNFKPVAKVGKSSNENMKKIVAKSKNSAAVGKLALPATANGSHIVKSDAILKQKNKPEPVKNNILKNFKIPTLIEAPHINPRTSKPVKRLAKPKQKQATGLAKLGGIFAIDNGWDKEISVSKRAPKPSEICFPKTETSPIPFVAKAPRKPIQFVSEVPTPFGINGNGNAKGHLDDDSKKRSKFSYDSENESDNDSDDNVSATRAVKRSLFSDSEDDCQAEVSMPVKILEPPMKRQKIPSQSDDELSGFALKQINGNEKKEINGNEVGVSNRNEDDEDDDDDAISLTADDVDFDDDDLDYEPPKKKQEIQKRPNKVEETTQYTTDLDELKMIVRKEPIVTASNARAAFMRNTDEIMKKPIEDATDKILNSFFASVCKGFIDNSCKTDGCKNPHRFPNVDIVAALFAKSSVKEIDDAYSVVSKHPRFLETYMSMFVELYIKRTSEYESRLARMIMDCEQNAKCHQLYRIIVEALVAHGLKQQFEAVEFLIKHHTPSLYANEVIMGLCVETGAEIIRFMNYLSRVFETQTIPNQILDKILFNCVKYQTASLPNFCLNNLLKKTPTQLRQLNQDSILKFIHLQTAYSDGNALREAKLQTLVPKIQGLGPTRAP